MPSKPPPAPPNHQNQHPPNPPHHVTNQTIRNQVPNGNYQKPSKTFNDMHPNNQQNITQNNNQLDHKTPPVANKPSRPQFPQPQPPPKEQTTPIEPKENKVLIHFFLHYGLKFSFSFETSL